MSWERPGDRMSTCPSCGRDVRITDDEVALGQSFCALCDQSFDVVSTDVGQGPNRQVALVEAARTHTPDARVELRPDGGLSIRARSAAPQLLAAGGLGVGIWLAISQFDGFFSAEGIVLTLLFGSLLATTGLGMREDLALDGDALVFKTGPFGIWRRRVRLEDIAEVTVERSRYHLCSAVLVLKNGGPIRIGGRFETSETTAAWLRERVLALQARGSAGDRS